MLISWKVHVCIHMCAKLCNEISQVHIKSRALLKWTKKSTSDASKLLYGWDSLMTCWLLWFTNYIAIPHANLHGSICYLESTKSTTSVTTKVSPFTTYTTLHPISLCPTATMFSHIDPLNAILQSCDLPCYGKIVAVLLQCDWTYFWWVWWYDMIWSEYTKKEKYRRT
jgi:hypothetical protein